MTAPRRGSYGIDAPFLLAVPAVLFLVNVVQGMASRRAWPFVGAAAVAGCAGLGLHASRRGKFVVWDGLLEGLRLRGDERILDVGCGRGAVLLMAAAKLTSGRAIGVDLWRAADQSGNAPRATWQNAEAEGIADKVDLCTADMTALPFPDSSFDLVVSNLAMHNVAAASRNGAVDEAARVLRPGGRLVIADVLGTRRYRHRLLEMGMADVSRRGLGWRVWWSGPWLATRLVTATKPAMIMTADAGCDVRTPRPPGAAAAR